jgi:signal transduction histidine kinase
LKLELVKLTIHLNLILGFSVSAILLMVVGVTQVLGYPAQLTLFLIVVSIAIVMVTGFVIYQSITRPINRIKQAVREISKGNFDTEIDLKSLNKDELGELALHIEQMKRDLKEKEHMKDEFISIASHELRTPIQPILNYVELAKRKLIEPDLAFDTIVSQARRLKALADDILDASRIEGKRLSLNIQYFDINEVIERVVEEKKLSLAPDVTTTFTPIQDPMVSADKLRIIQVLSNVIGNAVKFTKKGSIEVRCSVIEHDTYLQISVADTGGGIPDEIFARLFTKFASKSVEQGTEHGTGLGLFICKGIIEAHGGTISGTNNAQGGATFLMTLPLNKSVYVKDRIKTEAIKKNV